MNKLSILLACFILIGSLFAGDLVITKGGFGELTSAKLANYSYATKDKLGAVITEDTVLNRIDQKTNTLLDCGLFTCDYKIRVNAKQAIQFDADGIVGKGATVESVFFTDTYEVQKTRPKYGTQTKEECVINNQTLKQECKNVTSTIQTGTEIYYENETFENTAIPKLKLNETKTFTIRFTRKSMNDVVDIYHTILGQDRKDAAWWNTSYANRLPINCSLITAGTPIVINGSNGFSISGNKQVVWTICGGANLSVYYNTFTDYVVANDTAQVAMEVELGNGTSYLPTTVWSTANAVGVWHMGEATTLIDSAGNNNLTVGAGNFTVLSGAQCKIGKCVVFSAGAYFEKNTTTAIPINNANETRTIWAKSSDTTPNGKWRGFISTGTQTVPPEAKTRVMGIITEVGFKKFQFDTNGGVGGVLSANYGDIATYWYSWAQGTTIVNPSSFIMYYNNTLIGTEGARKTPLATTNAVLRIGWYYDGTATSFGATESTGLQDEVRIYSDVKSEKFINDTYYNAIGTAGYGTLGAEEIYKNLSISISQIAPLNSTFQTSNVSHIFSVNQSSTTNITIKFYLDDVLNQTLTQTANTTYNLTKTMADGLHSWYVFVYQTSNTSNNITSSNYTYTVDTNAPQNLSLNLVNNYFYYLNKTINLSFTEGFFKNCTININGTQFNMVNISSSVCQYNLSGIGNYTIYGTVNDLSGLSSNSSQVNISIFNYSFSTGFENPQYDMLTSPANITFTLNNYWGDIAANLTYKGTNYIGTRSGNTISTTIIPPIVSTTSTQNLLWNFAFTNSSHASSTSNTTTLYSSGLQLCGGLTNTTSINYTVLDSITYAVIANATFSVSIGQTSPAIKSAILSSSSKAICILPNMSVTASINETFSSPGYYSVFTQRIAAIYSNNQTNILIYLTNISGGGKQTIITVINNNLQPIPNIFVNIEQQNTTSGSFYQIISAQTDQNGVTTQILVPNTIFYRFTVLDSTNTTLGTYVPQVIACGLADTLCYVTLTVGQVTDIPYVSTFQFTNATCSWDNTTGTLSCTPVGVAPKSTLLTVSMTNSTAYNASICSQTGVGNATVTCILPTNANNCYNFAFGATLITGESIQLGGGQVCIAGTATFVDRSGIGLIITFVLVGILAILGLGFGPSGVFIGASFGLIIAIGIGFLTGMTFFGGIMGILMLWILAWLVR